MRNPQPYYVLQFFNGISYTDLDYYATRKQAELTLKSWNNERISIIKRTDEVVKMKKGVKK